VLKEGALANLIITSGELFDKETKIYENWIQGHRNIIKEAPFSELEGKYELAFDKEKIEIEISSKKDQLQLKAKKDSLKLGTKIDYKRNWLTFMLTETDSSSTQMNRFAALVTSAENEFSGKVFTHEGEILPFSAKRVSAEDKDEDSEDSEGKKIQKKKKIQRRSFSRQLPIPIWLMECQVQTKNRVNT